MLLSYGEVLLDNINYKIESEKKAEKNWIGWSLVLLSSAISFKMLFFICDDFFHYNCFNNRIIIRR